MSAHRGVTLTCDRCGEVFDDGQGALVREVRLAAASEGWRYESRRDLCPRCKNAAKKWPERSEHKPTEPELKA